MGTLETLEGIEKRLEGILVDLRNSKTVTLTEVTLDIIQAEVCVEEAKAYTVRAIDEIKRGQINPREERDGQI